MKATRLIAYCALMAFLLDAGGAAQGQDPPGVIRTPGSSSVVGTMGSPVVGSAATAGVTGQNLGYAFGPTLYFTGQLDDGLGYNGNLYTIDGLIPYHLEAGTNLLFLIVSGSATEDGRGVGSFGGGYRHYHEDTHRVYGGWLTYDIDDGANSEFHRLSFGVESLGKYFDARANGYVISGDESNILSSVFTGFDFSGNNLLARRLQATEHAYGGFDAEVGGPLPYFGQYGLNAYTGLYYFRSKDAERDDVLGWQLRGELLVTEDVTAGANYYQDPQWGESAYATLTVSLPDGKRHRFLRPRRVQERLRDRIIRQKRIQTDIQFTESTGLAFNPCTGLPYNIIHVNPNVGGSGSGTFEDPFGSMDALVNNAAADLIYVRGRTDGTNTNLIRSTTNDPTGTLVLFDNQRLLGAARDHSILTTEGPLVLPALDAFAPEISNGVMTATRSVITLANNNEVSGFTIDASNAAGTLLGRGIVGPAGLVGQIDGFNINNNTFNNYIDAVILNAYGVANPAACKFWGGGFDDNTLNGVAGISQNGFQVRTGGGTTLNLSMQRNTVTNNEIYGLSVVAADPGTVVNANNLTGTPSIGVAGNNASNNGTGISMRTEPGGTINVTADSNVTSANSGTGNSGFEMIANSGTINVESFTNNVASGNVGNGFAFEATGTGTMGLAVVSANTANSNGRHGMYVNATDSGTVSAMIGVAGNAFPDNTFIGNGTNATTSGDGLRIQANENGIVTGLITRNLFSASQNGGNGIGIVTDQTTVTSASASRIDVDILENTMSNNTGSGLFVQSVVQANSGFDVTSNIIVDVQTNQILGNQNGGIRTFQDGLNYDPPSLAPTGTPDNNRLFLTVGGPTGTEDVNDNGILDPGEDLNSNGILDQNQTNLIRNNNVAGIISNTRGTSHLYGLVQFNHITGTTGTDSDLDGVTEDGDGVRFLRQDDSLITIADALPVGEPAFSGGLLNNRMTGNAGDGVHFSAAGGDNLAAPNPSPTNISFMLMQDNLLSGNGGTGSFFETSDDAFLNVHAITNTVTFNTLQGMLIHSSGQSTFGPQIPDPLLRGRAIFDGNTVVANQRTGIDMAGLDRSRILLEITDDTAASIVSGNGTATTFTAADTNYTFPLQHLNDPTLSQVLPTGRGREGIRFNTNGGPHNILIHGGTNGQLISQNGNSTLGGNGVQLNFHNTYPNGLGTNDIENSTVHIHSSQIIENINGTNTGNNGDGINIAVSSNSNPSVLIGDPLAARGNLIQNNDGDGVSIGYADNSGQNQYNGTNEIVIRNNVIGDASVADLGNGNHGINVRADLSETVWNTNRAHTNSTVGTGGVNNNFNSTTAPVLRILDNTIAYNGRRGVSLEIGGLSATSVGTTLAPRSGGFTRSGMLVDVQRNLIASNVEEGIFLQTDPRFLQNNAILIPNIRDLAPAAPPNLPYDPANPGESGADFTLWPLVVEDLSGSYGRYSGYFSLETSINVNLVVLNNSIVNNGRGALAGGALSDGLKIRVGTNSYVSADVRNNFFDGNAGADIRTESFRTADLNPTNGTDRARGSNAFDTMILDDGAFLDMRLTGNTGDSGFSTTPNPDYAFYDNSDTLKEDPFQGTGQFPGVASRRVVFINQMDNWAAIDAANNFTANGVTQTLTGAGGELTDFWFGHGGADVLFPNPAFPPPVAPIINSP